MIKNKLAIYLAFLGILIIFIPDIIISKYSYPIVEGWWEFLSIETQHKSLYKDLYFSMPPLYIDTLRIFLNSGFDIFDIRVIFIVFHILEFIALSLFLSKYSNYIVGIISALFSELLIVSYHVAYLPKDYHMLLGLLVSTYLVTSYFLIKNKSNWTGILLGLIVGLIILTKQNVGGVLFLTGLTLILLDKTKLNNKIFLSISFIVGSTALLALYSYFNGFEWVSVYIGNDAKGGLLRVFGRFFFENMFRNALILVGLFYAFDYFKKKYSHLFFDLINNRLKNLLLSLVLFYLMISCAQNKYFELIISIVFSLLAINFVNSINPRIENTKILNFGILSVVPIALIYCNSMTAGFNFVGSQIGVAIFFVIALNIISSVNKKYLLICVVVPFFIISQTIYEKLRNGSIYQWWGYSIGSTRDAKFVSQYPDISGMYITKETNDILVATEVVTKKSTHKNIYFYPNIPFFYRIFDVPLLSKFPILWFDTIPSKFNSEIIQEFKELDPEYIVWLRPPIYAYSGHAFLTGRDSVMGDMDLMLLDGLREGKYKFEYVRPIGFGGELKDQSSPLTVSLICNSCKAAQLEADLISGLISAYSYPAINPASSGYISINFYNGKSFIEFCEKYKPLILNSPYPIFMILKKII